MPFAFNDDKSKLELPELLELHDIVVLEGNISNFTSPADEPRIGSADVSTSYNAEDYVVISSMTKPNDSRPGYESPWLSPRIIENDLHDSFMSISVDLSDHQVSIAVRTVSMYDASIDYRVILMKVA